MDEPKSVKRSKTPWFHSENNIGKTNQVVYTSKPLGSPPLKASEILMIEPQDTAMLAQIKSKWESPKLTGAETLPPSKALDSASSPPWPQIVYKK